MSTTDRCGTHRVTFSNLIDSRTGELVQVEVPNNLAYEGALLYAHLEGQQIRDDVRGLFSVKK